MKITIPIVIKVEIEEVKYTDSTEIHVSCPDYSVAIERRLRPDALAMCITDLAEMLSRRFTPERITYEIARHLGNKDTATE